MTSQLIHQRLYYYILRTGDTIKKQWQLLFILLGLFYANWDLSALVLPTQRLVSLQTPSVADFAFFSSFQLLVFLWIRVQRHAVTGGEVADFMNTLPIPWSVYTRTQILMFSVAMNVLWTPLILTLISIGGSPMDFIQRLTSLINLTALMLLLPATLLHFYAGKHWALLLCVFANALLAVSSLLGTNAMRILTSVLLIALVARLLSAPVPNYFESLLRAVHRHSSRAIEMTRRQLAKRFPVMTIHVKVLFQENVIYSLTRILGGSFLMFTVWRSVHTDQRTDIAATLLVTSAGLTALIMSGFYRLLHTEHTQYDAYTKTLPLPTRYWAVQDFIFVGSLFALVAFSYCLAAFILAYLNAFKLMTITISMIVLHFLLRSIVVKVPAHAVSLSWCVTLSVIALAWLALH